VVSDGLPEIVAMCGAELLPHAAFDDGSPAPIICTTGPHDPEAFHENEELGMRWKDDRHDR
jgi:hypothetical protein